MKKHLLLTIFLSWLSFAGWSQIPVFNNSGEGNNFYSNAENWLNGIKPENDGQAQFNARAALDENVTLSYIRSSAETTGLLAGGGTLTLSGGTETFVDLQQFTVGELLIDVPLLYRATDPAGQNLFRVDTDGGTIAFGPNSDLDVGAVIRLQGFPPSNAFANFKFDGIIRGTEWIQLGVNVREVVFGETSDNSNYEGQLIYFSPGTKVTANTAENGVLVGPGRKIQVNNNNGTLTLNGKNIYHGFIQIDGPNAFRWEFNADQPNLERLVIPGAGVITLALGNEVDSVHFDALSGNAETAPAWSSNASVVIENFKNAVLRFGQADTSLTVAQLAQINIGGNTVALNSNGYLVDPTLNTNPASSAVNLTFVEGFGSRTINLYSLVSDAEKDSIFFSGASSSAENVTTVSLNNNTLTFTEVARGTSTISVSATDDFGGSTVITFDVTVDQLPDSDGDGVPDANDNCPNTPAGEDTDENGCSASQLDDDNDGVSNALDLCPNTPSGINVNSDGCPDADGDGVQDDDDLCPETTEGAMVNADGCSEAQRDDDGDGVVNADDQCPGSESGAAVDENGCLIVLSTEINNSKAYIYPNPAVDYLMIKHINNWEGGLLVIHDMLGRLVFTQRIEEGQDKISIDHLKVGKYILQLQRGSEKELLKFLKSN